MRRARKDGGHILAGLMVAIAVMLILSAVTGQAWIDRIRRDNEAEMLFRAQEIVRGLKRFQKEQGRLPTELEELAEPGNNRQYFIRRLYDDPLVKNGKWGLLHLAPGGGIYDPNSASEQLPVGIGDQDVSGVQPLAQQIGTRRTADGGAEIGGLPIAGVKSLCKDKPFRILNDREAYEDWTFTVLDLNEAKTGIPGHLQPPAGQEQSPLQRGQQPNPGTRLQSPGRQQRRRN